MGCGSSKDKVEAAGAPSGGSGTKEAKKGKKAIDQLPSKANQEDIRDKYDLGEILGSGSFGQVREAKLKEDPSQVRAVKMIEPDKGDGEWSNQAIFVREIQLMQQMKHPNIIQYYDFYEDIHFLYVVMELCKGGEVFNKIAEMKRFSEKNAASIGQQMLKALEYIHDLSVAHRDIKAENFMLQDPSVHSNIKMIDFGMATKFKPDQVLTELCGSPHYLSPELIGQKYNHLADVWAFGVLLYLLMYGHYPYDAKHPRDIMVKILTEPIKWESKAKLSKEAVDFLKQLLEHNIKKRLTATQSLAHPWIKKVSQVEDATQILDTEVVRSAHKRVTGSKKTLNPKIEKLRNDKLLKIEEDFSKGIRHGARLGDTPKEEYMSKPEFVRHDNKITTAPSSQLNFRRTSIQNVKMKIEGLLGHASSGGMQTIKDEQNKPKEPEPGEEVDNETDLPSPMSLKKGRSASLTTPSPRRLSYLPGITKQDESSFLKLYEEKKTTGNLEGIVPGATPAGAPGSAEIPGLPAEKTDEE